MRVVYWLTYFPYDWATLEFESDNQSNSNSAFYVVHFTNLTYLELQLD